MRKMYKVMILAMIGSFATNCFGQDEWKNEKPLDNGTHLLFTISGGFEASSSTNGSESQALYGLDWGNTFNIYKLDDVDLAFGIRVSWIDVSFANQKIDQGFGIELNNYSALGSFFGIGPNITYKIQDKIGAEVYFKVKPSVYLNWSEYDDQITSDVSEVGFGTTNAFGIAARYDVLTLGFEIHGGTITSTQTTDSEFDSVDLDIDRVLSYTRFFVGFRF